MTRRIGVMGGMFDPVHNGHLQAAMMARNALQLDQLRMIPCHQPGHRAPATCSSSQRLEMLHLATSGMNHVIVDDREIRRGGYSYTVDTLESLKAEFPDAVLVLVMGMDAFNSLPGWQRWQRIFELAHIVVIGRPGYGIEPGSDIGGHLARRLCDSVQAMFERDCGSILVMDDLKSPLSSTEVRRRIRAGISVAEDVPQPVEAYLLKQGIYGGRARRES